jgi:hypothetical protein
MKHLSVTAALTLLCVGLPLHAQTIDILGIAPGMSRDEAARTIRDYIAGKSNFQELTERDPLTGRPHVWFIGGGGGVPGQPYKPPAENLAAMLSSETSGNEVIAATRRSEFEGTVQPAIDDTIAPLTAKYGRPAREGTSSTDRGKPIRFLRWIVRSKDEEAADRATMCWRVADPPDLSFVAIQNQIFRTNPGVTHTFFWREIGTWRFCGVMIDAPLRPSETPNRLASMTVTFVDYRRAVQIADREARLLAEKRTQEDLARPRAPAPKL